MEQKITKNFSFYEFAPNQFGKGWIPDSKYLQLLIVNLANNMQIVRDAMPVNLSISISSGVRNKEDYDRLVSNGYNPSETSDHNYGNAVLLKYGSDKYLKYGPTYNFSVGAVDCVPNGITAKELFNLTMDLVINNKCKFGQVIYERDPVRRVEWIHLGGYAKYYFNESIVNLIDKKLFLSSIDSGKTYQEINKLL